MTSISPMELWKSTGITSYICGQSAQRISESYYMLKHALDYQSPQVVLLETNMLFRYTNTPDSLRSSISDTAMYYFPVLQYHNLWKNIVNDQIPEGWQSYKGFCNPAGSGAVQQRQLHEEDEKGKRNTPNKISGIWIKSGNCVRKTKFSSCFTHRLLR